MGRVSLSDEALAGLAEGIDASDERTGSGEPLER